MLKVGFVQRGTIDKHLAAMNLDPFAGQGDDALNQIHCTMTIEDDDVAALRGSQPVRNFVDDNPFALVQIRLHAGTLNLKTADGSVDYQKNNRR